MPLGGSVTYGVGSSDQNGYRKMLLALLSASGYQVCMVGSRKTGAFYNNEHEGWRGQRIDQIERKARVSAERLLPHIFTVNVGSNDCLQAYRLVEMMDRLRHLLETLWTVSPASTIILSSLLLNRDAAVNMRVATANAEMKLLAKAKELERKRIVFVDMQESHGPRWEDLVEDGTHPNDNGYKRMAQVWFRGIQLASDRGFLSTGLNDEAK